MTKGLVCGGYPPKYKFIGVASRGKWKGLREPLPQQRLNGRVHVDPVGEMYNLSDESPQGQDITRNTNSSPSDVAFLDSSPSNVNSEDVMQGLENDALNERHEIHVGIEELLAADRTEMLLSYCKTQCNLQYHRVSDCNR